MSRANPLTPLGTWLAIVIASAVTAALGYGFSQ